MRFIRIPFCINLLTLDELNPFEIPEWNLTILFGTETIAKWRRIAQDEPENATAHSKLGGLLVIERRYEEAIVAYQDALQVFPTNEMVRQTPDYVDNYAMLKARLYYELGNALLACGRRGEARAEWEKALELNGYFGERAQRQLIEFPADGSTPKRKYLLVVADHAGNVRTQEFDDKDTAYRQYQGLKPSVREDNLGVGLAKFHPDGTTYESAWIESRKGKAAKKRFMTLVHQQIGVQ